MKRIALALLACLTAVAAGCESGGYIAVDNDSDRAVFLRVRREVWVVPSGSMGLGPYSPEPTFVELLDEDCRKVNMWGIHDAVTVRVESNEVTLIENVEGITEELSRSTTCPLDDPGEGIDG